jgi:hypothetical protein
LADTIWLSIFSDFQPQNDDFGAFFMPFSPFFQKKYLLKNVDGETMKSQSLKSFTNKPFSVLEK